MLYKLDKADIKKSAQAEIASLSDFGITEKDLENFLSSRLTDVVFEDELMLIGQERAFQAEADLLALDKDGVLYIFELKRWESRREDLLQVLRYGQKFGPYTYDDLESLARGHGKLKSDWSLSDAHRDVFGVSLEKTDFNCDQVFVLVTNGVDEETLSAASYWSSKGLKIFCMPYDIFKINGEPYLQMRPYSPTGATVVERNTGFYIVNTNATYMPDAWKEMLGDRKTGKAAAYYGRKAAVCSIQSGSKVYLYHTGQGVIAKGEATSSFRVGDSKQHGEEEYYVPLKFKWAYEEKDWHSKVPTAREINWRLGSGHRFRQTAFSISKKMATTIDEIREEKRQCKSEDS